MSQPARALPAQHQNQQPGIESEMHPAPKSRMENYKAASKLKGKNVLITGGDSGIGRAVAIGFAKEGANVAIIFLKEDDDAKETKRYVEAEGRACILIEGDIGEEAFCAKAVSKVADAWGRIDVLINNAAEQHVQEQVENITGEQLERTFRTNLFSQFYLTQQALKYMPDGGSIINTTSITAYKGKETLIDYASTKGAIVSFTRSLSQSLVKRNIRVNAVAPGPIWTPLIPATFDAEHVAKFGSNTPMGRPGQPDEVAPCFIFLASDDASYMTGQVLHPNGGTVVNG